MPETDLRCSGLLSFTRGCVLVVPLFFPPPHPPAAYTNHLSGATSRFGFVFPQDDLTMLPGQAKDLPLRFPCLCFQNENLAWNNQRTRPSQGDPSGERPPEIYFEVGQVTLKSHTFPKVGGVPPTPPPCRLATIFPHIVGWWNLKLRLLGLEERAGRGPDCRLPAGGLPAFDMCAWRVSIWPVMTSCALLVPDGISEKRASWIARKI